MKWLGSGLYVCGVCGDRKLRVGTSTGGRRTYRCSNRNDERTTGHVAREAIALDSYVEKVVVARLSQPGVVEYLTTRSDATVEIDALQERRAELEARLDELVSLHACGAITARQLVVGSETLKCDLEDVEKKLTAEVHTGPFVDLVGVSDIGELWFGNEMRAGMPLGVRRAIVDQLMDITILPAPNGRSFRPEYVEITWKS
ncbi:zinc ribbon domain-containing protein [Prescottella defluvii]|nr:zinc ribbon domain-containing protein [Prescottella defluvii]